MIHFCEYFQTIVEKYPSHIALQSEGFLLTYQEVWFLANSFSDKIKKKLTGKENLIGLILEPSPILVILILGIWLSENAFLPIEAGLPEERIAFQLKDSKCCLLFVGNFFSNKNFNIYVEIGRVNENSEDTSIHFSKEIWNLKENDSQNRKNQLSVERLAYLIYTSGSSGQPKGVLVNHSGIVNFLQNQIPIFQVNSQSRFYQFLSVGFDAFISELGNPLLSGATLFFGNRSAKKSIYKLISELESQEITHICLPPALLSEIPISSIPKTLKTIIIGGEVTPISIVKLWSLKLNLVNVYGPTEATVCTHLVRCDSNWDKNYLGNPISGLIEKIWDEDGKDSFVGELILGGDSIARGYLQQGFNRNKFFIEQGIRFYRTGDLVERTLDGNLVFLGRIDRQIKIRGQRTELEEIERQIENWENVKKAIVLPISVNDKNILVGFVEWKQRSKNFPFSQLQIYLKKYLPVWMIPETFIDIQSFPLNSNGKIDFLGLDKIFKESLETNTSWEKKLFQNVLAEKYEFWKENYIRDLPSLDWIRLELELEKQGLYFSEILLSKKISEISLSDFWKEKEITYSIQILKQEVERILQTENTKRQIPCLDAKKSVLVLGGTGFLGKFIIYELLRQTNRKIYVLIHRKESWTELENFLIAKNCSSELHRIQAFDGNLKNRYSFSLDFLTEEVSDIYYLAGNTNSFLSYKNLEINYEPLKELIEFSKLRTSKTIHLASSLGMLLLSEPFLKELEEISYSQNIQSVRGGYAFSKLIAESLVEKGDIPYKIYRLGLLVGDSRSGATNPKDFFSIFLKSANFWENLHWNSTVPEMDFTPVDIAASLFVKISLSKEKQTYYHICNPNPLGLDTLIQTYKEYAKKYRPLSKQPDETSFSYLEFLQNSIRSEKIEKTSRQLFLRTQVAISTKNIKPFLLGLPDFFFSVELLKKYLEFAFAGPDAQS